MLEIGYRNPTYHIAEWSLTIVLPNLLQVLFVTMLAVTFVLILTESRRLSCKASKAGAAAVGTGAGLLAFCSASLTWVVCCGTPSWVVALSVLGVSVPVAQDLLPYGSALTAVGVALLVGAIVMQSRRLAMRQFPANLLRKG